MKKIALASSNLYENWYTYNFEYLVEHINNLYDKNELFFFGKDRFSKNDNNINNIGLNYLLNNLDIIIINFSDIFHDKNINFSIEILKKLEKKTKIVMIVSDPWRFREQIEQYLKELDEVIWLVHSDYFTNLLKNKYKKKIIKMFPYFVGEKYKDMMLKRIYEISFIGRCEIKDKKLNISKFKNNKIFHEETLSKLRKRLIEKRTVNKIFDIVINLNRSVFAYNSFPKIKGLNEVYHTPFRFVESSACGAISISPFYTDELIKYYYPKNLILNCNNSYTGIKDILDKKNLNNDKIFDLKEKIKITTKKNHMAKNRFNFILSLCDEQLKNEAEIFYEK